MVGLSLWIWTNFNSVFSTDFYKIHWYVTKCLSSYLNAFCLSRSYVSTVLHLLCVSGGWLVWAASNGLSSLLASGWGWLTGAGQRELCLVISQFFPCWLCFPADKVPIRGGLSLHLLRYHSQGVWASPPPPHCLELGVVRLLQSLAPGCLWVSLYLIFVSSLTCQHICTLSLY